MFTLSRLASRDMKPQ